MQMQTYLALFGLVLVSEKRRMGHSVSKQPKSEKFLGDHLFIVKTFTKPVLLERMLFLMFAINASDSCSEIVKILKRKYRV